MFWNVWNLGGEEMSVKELTRKELIRRLVEEHNYKQEEVEKFSDQRLKHELAIKELLKVEESEWF